MNTRPANDFLPCALACAALVLLFVGCGDDDDDADHSAVSEAGTMAADGAVPACISPQCSDAVRATCARADAGTPCGDDRHCIDGRCLFNTCGDGIRAADEACDDGNEAIGDGCDPACRNETPPSCGDGQTAKDEECDDGNRHDLDDCSNACTTNACGNGRVDGREECDDGNRVDADGCSNACRENRCRNGRLDPGEECDDGNRVHDDGCSNGCRIVVCGNGKTEGDEECDDGNGVDADGCSNACTGRVCGNGRIDPGEVCDGDTVEYACAADCTRKLEDMCRPCEDQFCTTYQGADWVAGCFLGEPPSELVPELDPLFAQDCIDVVDCARRTGCGFDPALAPAVDCYCGAISVDACNLDGPAADAPCADEWRAATRGATNTDVLVRISDISVPSGWAYYLMLCDREYCADACVP
jgi:cysteine-rich repeat protein